MLYDFHTYIVKCLLRRIIHFENYEIRNLLFFWFFCNKSDVIVIAYSIDMFRCPSVLVSSPLLNIFYSDIAGPINAIFHVEPQCQWGA